MIARKDPQAADFEKRREFMPKDLAEMTLEELWQLFPIELVPPRPEWPVMYAAESAGLKNRLPADWIVRMEHIGSTAVGTIWAKPIVDILVETTGEADWEVLKTILLDAGIFVHESVGKSDGFQQRIYAAGLCTVCLPSASASFGRS